MVDGVPGKKGYDAIGTAGVSSLSLGTFSPDSKRVAYVGITYGENPRTDKKWFVVIDGEEGDAYSGDYASFTFSPDSKHVAYVAVQGKKEFVIVDETRGKNTNDIVFPRQEGLSGTPQTAFITSSRKATVSI